VSKSTKARGCVRRNSGSLESRAWQRGGDLLDSDHDPNPVTAAVHDRMPVILDLDSYDLWLDAGLRNVDFVSELLKPQSARMMRSYPLA
jgi:hypothetical protein